MGQPRQARGGCVSKPKYFSAAAIVAFCTFSSAWCAETVFVAGATGRTGSEIVVRLANEGYHVRALARDTSKAKIRNDRVEWVAGDVRDFDGLKAAMAGATFVVSAIGAIAGTGPNSPEFVDFAGTRNLVDAAKAHGVQQFVVIASGRTGPHIDHSTRTTMGYTRYFKTKGEEYLKSSGVPFTILGAAGLLEKPRAQTGVRFFSRVEYDATTKSTDEMVVIAISDIADVVAAALKDPAAKNKAFAVMNDPSKKVDAWRADFQKTELNWP